MSDAVEPPGPLLPTVRWWRRFGRRNLGYIAFVVLVIPFGIALEASGPGGPDRGGGVGAALMLWGIVSLAFFAVNAALLVFALRKGAARRQAIHRLRPAGCPHRRQHDARPA